MKILLRVLVFLAACFFLLPLFKIEDPIRSLGLRFMYAETEGFLYEHQCDRDRVYRYEYSVNTKRYQQFYTGYNEKIENSIPDSLRCSGKLNERAPITVRYFIGFPLWSEPSDAERLSIGLFIMVNAVKVIAIILLIWIFIRN